MFTFVTFKAGVKTNQPHMLVDMEKANIIFQHLLLQNSKVQMLVNGNLLKESVNPTISNDTTATVLASDGTILQGSAIKKSGGVRLKIKTPSVIESSVNVIAK